MMKSETREIDGLSITVGQLPAMKGFKTLSKITRIVGPALAKAAVAATGEIDFTALADAVEILFKNLTEADLESLTRELLATATVLDAESGKMLALLPQFDLVFQGKYDALLKTLAFAFEVNYGSFTVALRGLRDQVTAKKPVASSSAGSITSLKPGLAGG